MSAKSAEKETINMGKDVKKNGEKNNPNAGHRGRLKTKYKKGGMNSLEFHEILELLLFYSIPRKDTNKIAHELAKKFRCSLADIFESSDKMLKEVTGVGNETVLFFNILKDITRLYNLDISNKSTEKTAKEFHENHIVAHFTGKQQEELILITLNNRMERISVDIIYTGSVNSTKVDIQKIVKIAIDKNASGVIVAHNHPNGPDYPSPEDIDTTRRLENIFGEISIHFVDHYVVSDKKITSIRDFVVYSYINIINSNNT